MTLMTDSESGGGGGGKEVRMDAIRNKIEGPTPNQSLAEYLNRTHVSPVVRKCFLQKDTKVVSQAVQSSSFPAILGIKNRIS